MKVDKTDTKSFLFSVCIFLFIAIVRLLLNENYTLLQMSCLNLLALDYVLFHIFQQASSGVKKKINISAFPHSTKKRKSLCVNISGTCLFLVLVVAEVVYVINFGNATFNDIISIIALFVSIEDNRLVECVFKFLSLLIRM